MDGPIAIPTPQAPLTSIERVFIWILILIDIWTITEILDWQPEGFFDEWCKVYIILQTPLALATYFGALCLDVSLTEAEQLLANLLYDGWW